ncbi:hypothetical protein KL86DPRO_20043 [uncultured delta proteobacterium]|uniref:Uncharacterized protein n=1 Tax=uncultured delta proteobacterium TaxID=34034 RepID=A0A212JTS9_9DELT|nr:hypothetical protein KL86DPRO_20043 [uncultured delta proteobacterium]
MAPGFFSPETEREPSFTAVFPLEETAGPPYAAATEKTARNSEDADERQYSLAAPLPLAPRLRPGETGGGSGAPGKLGRDSLPPARQNIRPARP